MNSLQSHFKQTDLRQKWWLIKFSFIIECPNKEHSFVNFIIVKEYPIIFNISSVQTSLRTIWSREILKRNIEWIQLRWIKFKCLYSHWIHNFIPYWLNPYLTHLISRDIFSICLNSRMSVSVNSYVLSALCIWWTECIFCIPIVHALVFAVTILWPYIIAAIRASVWIPYNCIWALNTVYEISDLVIFILA